MSNVLPFRKPAGNKAKAAVAKKPKQSKTLCRHGFHKWQVCTGEKFDVKQGKLVTVYQCTRCGKKKITAH